MPQYPVTDGERLAQKLADLAQASRDKREALAAKPTPLDPVVMPDNSNPYLNTVKDVGIKLAQGVVDAGQFAVGLSSAVTGGLIGQGMHAIGYNPEETNQLLGQYLSPEQQEADLKVQQAKGFKDTILASLDNPRSIMGSVVESLPGMAAGMAVTSGLAARIALKAALATEEGSSAAYFAAKGGADVAKAGEAALATKAGAKAAQEAIDASETKLLVTGAASEGAQSTGQIVDQAQSQGRDYSDYILPAVAAGVGTAGLNLLAGKIMGSAETDLAAGTHTLKGNLVTKLAKEGFSEGVLEELPQSYQEQVFTNIATGKPWDEGTSEAAAQGLLAGAAMGAGFGGLHGIGHDDGKASKPATTPLSPEDQATKAKTMVEAVQNGDPSALLDQKSKVYDPIAAVAVLSQMNKKDDTTPEDRTKNVESAYEIVKNLNQQRDDLVQQAKGKPKSEAKRLMTEATRINDQMNQAQGVWDVMLGDLMKQPKAQDVAVQVQAANTSVDPNKTDVDVAEAAKQSAGNVVQLATQSPEAISARDAKALATNMNNGLDDDQREYLRAFSDARLASNLLKTGPKVSQEILYGSSDNVGLLQYRDRIGRAIAAGAQKAADYQLSLLDKFSQDHAAKAQAARQALTQYGLGSQIQKTDDGRWIVPAKSDYLGEGALRKNGGWEVRSAKGVVDFEREADALAKTRDELKLAMDMHFGQAPVQSSVAAPSVPATPSVATDNSTPSPSINTKENGEGGARLEDKSLQTVAGAPLSTEENQGIKSDDPLFQQAVDHVSQFPEFNAKTIQDHLGVGYNRAMRMIEAMQSNGLVSQDGNSGTYSFTRSAPATPASSLADARSSQVAAPALVNPPNGNGEQAAAEGQGEASAKPPAREAASAKGALNIDWNKVQSKQNTGGSSDGRSLASTQEVKALRDQMDQVPKYQGADYTPLSMNRLVQTAKDPEGTHVNEVHALRSAMYVVKQNFAKELGEVRFVAFDHATRRGTMFNSHNIIALNHKLFHPDNADQLVRTIAHELAHRRDANNGWTSNDATALQEGGVARNAIIEAMKTNTLIREGFNHLLGDNLSKNYTPADIARELYAQLMAYHLTNPELFHEGQPLAATIPSLTALETFNGDQGSDQKVQSPVAQGQPVSDGKGSGETGSASTGSGEGTGHPRQSGGTAVESAPATGLRLFAQKLKTLPARINDAFRTAGFNPVAQFLQQRQDSLRYKTARPLVAVGDFLSQWAKNPDLPYGFIEEYVKGDRTPTDQSDQAIAHNRALDNLYPFLVKWNSLFPQNFVNQAFKGNVQDENIYRYADAMQYLLEHDKIDVEENVKTAMSASAYQFILGQANSPEFKTREQVLTMNGLDKEGYLHPDGEKALRSMIGFEDAVLARMGQFAADALGFQASDDAPQDLLARVHNALGAHILLQLEKEGYVNRVAYPQETVQGWFKQSSSAEDQSGEENTQVPARDGAPTMLTYIQFNHKADGVKGIKESNFGTGALIERLFGSEKAPRIAGTTSVKFTQKYAKNTQQEISDIQRQAIQETMDTPHHAIPEMLKLFKGMGRDAVLKVAGWINVDPDLGPVYIHDANTDSTRAQNQNLENQYDIAFDGLASHGEDAKFYVEQSVWKNFRAGFSNQSLNQQTSKIHRALFARPDWHVSIDMKNGALVDEYRVALAMMLGVKTDSQENVRTLAKFDKELAENPEIMQAVDIIRKNTLGDKPVEWTPAESDLVSKVAGGREGMMTLQALMSFAQFEQAKATGASNFQTTLLVGVDGKTNGPMLSHLALGAAGDIDQFYALLNRGGFYSTDANQPEHFSEWYGRGGNQDLYENLGASIVGDMRDKLVTEQEMAQRTREAKAATKQHGKGSKESGQAWGKVFGSFTESQLAAVEMVTKQLVDRATQEATKQMRKMSKGALNPFAFGSSLNKSVASMQNGFIENHYANLQDMASGASQQNLREYLQSINTLIAMSDHAAPQINVDLPMEAALKTSLTGAQEAALRKSFNRVIGDSVKSTMKSYFDTYIQRRQDLNTVVQTSYEVFQAAYQVAKVEEMKRLMDEGKLAYTETKVGKKPVHDLTIKQERELRQKLGIAPVMHSSYSIGQNSIGHGLYMAGSENMTSESQLYKSTTYTKLDVPKATGVTGKAAKRFSSKMQAWVEKAPGVIGGSYPIHSGDSAIMHNTLLKVKQTLNVHDEGSNSIHNVRDMARALNEHTAKTFLNYSPAREALHMFERMVTQLADAIKEGRVGEGAANLMFKGWADAHNARQSDSSKHITPEEAATLFPKVAMDNAFRADYMRLLAFTKLKSVDQYVWEGGQFEVTPEMRALAQERLDALSTELQQGTKNALAYLAESASENQVGNIDPHGWLNIRTAGMFGSQATDTGPMSLEQTPAIQAMIKEAVPSPNRESSNDVVAKTAEAAKDILSPWGELGAPVNGSNQRLEDAFKAQPVMSSREVLKLLQKELGREKLQGLYAHLINMMARYLPDIEVRYVTKDTPVTDVLDGADKSRGWYVSKGGQHAVYLLSTEHKMSQLTVETVLHELLHAGLARTIESELAKARTSAAYVSEKLQLVQELQTLFEKAQNHVAKNHIAGFDEAMKDVHEFISWGLTNKNFQDQVISQISMKTTTAKTGLVQGMKDFITKVANLLFFNADKSHQDRAVNGMAILMTNVAGLYSQAAKADSRIGIVNRMAAGQNLRDYSTHDIFNALTSNSSVSSQFEGQLRGVLDNIVGKLFGPMGSFREAVMRQSPQLPEDILQHAIQTGQAPFASKIMAAGFLMSDQEAFVAEQVEASVKAALESKEGQTAIAHKELAQLYEEAAKAIKPQDLHDGSWTLATQAEQDHAKQLHKFLFTVEQGADKKSDYLSRFAALGLANERIASALGFQTAINTDSMAGKTFSQRLYSVFEKILTWINGKLTHTYGGQMADAKLSSLVEQLVGIEARKRNRINSDQMKMVGAAEDVLKNLAEGARKKVGDLANSSMIRNSRNVFIQAGGALVSTVAHDRVGEMMKHINTMRNTLKNKKRGVIMGLFDEVRGANQSNLPFHILLRATKVIEGDRKKIITAVGKATRESFDDKGGYLTDKHNAAISAVALRGDMASLLGPYDMKQLHELVSSPLALKEAIRLHEQELQQFGNFQHYYSKQAKALAWNRVTGEAKVKKMLFNAYSIARAHATEYAGRVSDTQARNAEQIIDPLVSLYALQYASQEKKALLDEIMTREAARSDKGNGLEMVLLTHKQLQEESRQRLFTDAEALRMKGYVPEIYNHHIEVVAASGDEAEILKKIGYSEQTNALSRDPADSSEAKKLYVYRDGGLQSYLSGIVSMTGMNSRGSPVYGADAPDFLKAKNSNDQEMFRADPNFNPARVKENFAVPTLNSNGEAVEYRYMMTELSKDTLLERHNGFDRILGQMAGNIYDKEKSRDQNRKAVEALKEQFDKEYHSNPSGYMRVGPKSQDKELRDIWRLFPQSMKDDIRDVWGHNDMLVRSDLLDINFGYRKLSLSSALDKDANLNNIATKMFQDLLVHIYKEDSTEEGKEIGRRKAQLKVRIVENVWQELVKMAKENMVVKSMTTLMGNFRSNVLLLLWSGVNPADIIKHHRIAMKGALDYRKANNELIQLKMTRDAGYLAGRELADMNTRIIQLEDSLARNPVKPLIDAGMMPTIVEDVAADDDLYSYRSRYTRGLEQKLDNLGAHINPQVKTAFDWITMGKDTPLYKAMSYGTQLSDFVARYTLYQHLTNRQTNPIKADEALNRVSEAFVNYDIPSQRKVQYANDMGLVYFTKYYLRIQKVLIQLYRENPGRAMAMLIAGHYFDMASELTNSSFIHHIGNNPFDTGALKAVTTLDQTAVMKAILSPFK